MHLGSIIQFLGKNSPQEEKKIFKKIKINVLIFYFCIANYYQFKRLKQHTCTISQFLWIRSSNMSLLGSQQGIIKVQPRLSFQERVSKNLLATDLPPNSLWYLIKFISLQQWNRDPQLLSGSQLEAFLTHTGNHTSLPQGPLTYRGRLLQSQHGIQRTSQLARLSLT